MAGVKIKMRRRMTMVLICVLAGFFCVIAKLAVVQLVQGSELKQEAEEVRTRDLGVAASRGTIYDRNGNKLAVSITADSLAALPPAVESSGAAEDTAKFLAEKLGMDYEEVYEKITSDTSYVWIKRKIDFDVAQIIKEAYLKADEEGSGLLAGINFEQETQRYYPRDTLAAHVLGYAGIVYHAWLSVFVEGTGWVDNVVYFDGVDWQRMDPTFADAEDKKAAARYIGDGTNYISKFFY